MRITSIVTSILVAAAIYIWVLERDWLFATFGEGPLVTDSAAPEPETPEIVAERAPAPAGGLAVVAQQSTAQNVVSGVLLRGRTEATRIVELRSEAMGRVVSQPLRKGASVAEGQLMCELDPGTLNVQLAEAGARQAEAEANTTATLQLAERGFASETSALSARAAIESANAAVLRIENAISQLQIFAPFSGILESDTAELGSLLQPGALCGTIIALETVRLVGFVPEIDVGKLQLGQPAGGRLVSGRELIGTISFISRSADSLTRTYRVEIEIPNADLSIRDGETAEIFIALAGEQGHLLPQSVLTLNDEGEIGVRVVEDGKAMFRTARIIRDAPEGVWLGDLPGTITVITVGQEYVNNGTPVTITFSEASE